MHHARRKWPAAVTNVMYVKTKKVRRMGIILTNQPIAASGR